jgi:hypothetical protein
MPDLSARVAEAFRSLPARYLVPPEKREVLGWLSGAVVLAAVFVVVRAALGAGFGCARRFSGTPRPHPAPVALLSGCRVVGVR